MQLDPVSQNSRLKTFRVRNTIAHLNGFSRDKTYGRFEKRTPELITIGNFCYYIVRFEQHQDQVEIVNSPTVIFCFFFYRILTWYFYINPSTTRARKHVSVLLIVSR